MKRSCHSENLLVNETFIVDHSINEMWTEWFSENFIKALTESGFLKDIVFSRIKHDHNPDGISYALQYQIGAENLSKINNDENILHIRAKMLNRFNGLIASFKTEMEILE